ncbi:hypothetical protein GCM10010911_17020 [Paenibacillus nasutitermitis]|uniref:Uncharacterized protein n=1 Tax=Paenibacillus nasutitermitis TaxID=1652958 RepID=A0A916YSN1_9BACL|nr:hypothetical protein GCM10010911_17020 [Paenibacillus nasutitermitis]
MCNICKILGRDDRIVPHSFQARGILKMMSNCKIYDETKQNMDDYDTLFNSLDRLSISVASSQFICP